jgi:hypothetical protein
MNCERCLKRKGWVRPARQGYRFCAFCIPAVLHEMQRSGYLTTTPYDCKRHYEEPLGIRARTYKEPPLWWDDIPRAYEEALELDRP